MSDDLRRAFERIAELEATVTSLRVQMAALERATGLFADEKDLLGRLGNPEVKFSPRAWQGDNCVGRKFSECPPEFLDMLAEALAWSAANPKPGKERYAKYNATDAARARGWARRLRLGGAPPNDPGDTNGVDHHGDAFEAPCFDAPEFDGAPEAEEKW